MMEGSLSQSSQSSDDSMEMPLVSGLVTPGGPAVCMVSAGKKRRHIGSVDVNDEEYKRRRERNNEAVRKCRIKSRLKSKEMAEKVSSLREENALLNQKVVILTKELNLLKELFLTHAKGANKSSISNIITQSQMLNSQSLPSTKRDGRSPISSSDHIYVKSEILDDSNESPDPIVDLSMKRPGIVVDREVN